ncbi:hypothetical protein FRB95_008611 [Tulasnella sp. JGI-2019a]|nr:hypothetical protein FRB95_008611 [Tulasnella sp. JGI-2019a]
MSLNPASQPFIPSTFIRRDSALRLGGDQVVYNSASNGDGSGVTSGWSTKVPLPPDIDDDEGPLGSHHGAGSRTPGRTENSTGLETVIGEANDRPLVDSRFSSAASLSSSAASFLSARSSPRTPPEGELVTNETSKDGIASPGRFSSYHPISQHTEQQQILTDSPRGSISSLSRSASQDTESGESLTLSKADAEDSLSPLLKSSSSASFPALEAHFRRDGTISNQRDTVGSSANNVGPESVSSTSSGFLSSSGLDASLTNGGQRPGFQLSPSPLSRLGSRFTPYGNLAGGGSANRSHTPINDLAPGSQTQQLYQTQVQSPSASRSMSLSLMTTPNGNTNSNTGLPSRKSTFAFDYSPHHTPPSRSPLPTSFQNYNLGSSGIISQHPSATNTPTDSGFRHTANNLVSNNSLNPLSVGADNMSSSPSSSVRSSAGYMFEAAANFDAQAKASPFLNDLLDRIIRCEHSTNLIQRELSELNAKVSLLFDRLSGPGPSTIPGGSGASRAQANETHRGATGNAMTPTGGTPGVGGNNPAAANFYSFPNNSSTSSLISPAPHGGRDRDRDEEISQLNQRISTLTISVGQLLAAQSQSHIQNMNAGFSAPSPGGLGSGLSVASPRGLGGGGGGLGLGMGMGTPTMNGTPDMPHTPLGGLGGNRSDLNASRPSPRAPIPVRTWSSGSVDMLGVGGRSDSAIGPPMPRDKRRSIIATGRRDSTGDPGGDWTAGGPRDANAGPVISKWEHLPLMPELLRSISKYGVGPPNKIQQRALPFLLRGADIIAQAPPTQERIAAYVIPAIHFALTVSAGSQTPNRGPIVLIVSTTVDQATQAQRMIRDMGGPIGVRSALAAGTGGDIAQELRFLHQNMPHILCGTPQKLHTLFTAPGGPTGPLPGSEVRFLVLDEVDQLIARNLHDFVFSVVKLLPPPRSRPLAQITQTSSTGSITPLASPAIVNGPSFNPVDATSPTVGSTSFPAPIRRFSSAIVLPSSQDQVSPGPIERQTALFSNTVPQDVLNLANTIQLREPVRVLVRRDGNVAQSDPSTTSRGLRQYYLYLAFTAAGAATRNESKAGAQGGGGSGLGIIGSGRSNGSTLSSAETNQAREWKLDALSDLFDDLDVGQVIVHVGGMTALEAVVYKLASRGLETVPFHGDMGSTSRTAALNKFRGAAASVGRNPVTRVLVVYDVQVKAPDVFQIPLIINYDLPKAVEEYAHRVAPAISNSYSRSGVVVNFVTATGGDVEMLRSIECFYKIKCPEVPMSLRDVL